MDKTTEMLKALVEASEDVTKTQTALWKKQIKKKDLLRDCLHCDDFLSDALNAGAVKFDLKKLAKALGVQSPRTAAELHRSGDSVKY
jgi:hypothetical protein